MPMDCYECKDGKMGGTANCVDCEKEQTIAIIRFFNGDIDADAVANAFGVIDTTSGCDGIPEPLTLSNFLNDDVGTDEETKPLYDVMYWSIIQVLEDEKSDILKLQKPIDLDKDVSRIREEILKICE